MRFARLLPLALMAGLSACTTVHAGSQAEAYRDPWEHTNRDLYAFNKGLDKYALKPVTQVYRTVTPVAARHGVSNVFNNIDEPLSFINAILQGKIKQAFRTADRFLLNTTLGVGGLADVATDMGRPEEPEDFGQTLAVWGVGTGPYLMVPLLGPSTARDLTGFVVDFFTDPVGYGRNSTIGGGIEIRGGQFAAEVIDLRRDPRRQPRRICDGQVRLSAAPPEPDL
jgi:phospholipid-binding lipoprotein MlaA